MTADCNVNWKSEQKNWKIVCGQQLLVIA